MRYFIPFVFVPPLLLGIVGVIFTLMKLDKMEQIRGWKPGAVTKREVIRQKFEHPETGTCWVAFTDEDIRRGGAHRMHLETEKWDRIRIGDEIEVVYVLGDPTPYTIDGIFASDGNFAFDRGLVAVEVAMIVFSLLGAVGSVGILVFLDFLRGRKVNSTKKCEPDLGD